MVKITVLVVLLKEMLKIVVLNHFNNNICFVCVNRTEGDETTVTVCTEGPAPPR